MSEEEEEAKEHGEKWLVAIEGRMSEALEGEFDIGLYEVITEDIPALAQELRRLWADNERLDELWSNCTVRARAAEDRVRELETAGWAIVDTVTPKDSLADERLMIMWDEPALVALQVALEQPQPTEKKEDESGE